MKIEDIFSFFESHPMVFINDKLAVCYIVAVLVREDSYGTELIQRLGAEYPGYRVSDTVLYIGLQFLREEGVITSYWKKAEGPGRPRRMYQIDSGADKQAQNLARLWHQYVQRACNPIAPDLELRSRELSDVAKF